MKKRRVSASPRSQPQAREGPTTIRPLGAATHAGEEARPEQQLEITQGGQGPAAATQPKALDSYDFSDRSAKPEHWEASKQAEPETNQAVLRRQGGATRTVEKGGDGGTEASVPSPTHKLPAKNPPPTRSTPKRKERAEGRGDVSQTQSNGEAEADTPQGNNITTVYQGL
jgi:hypothetical protein